MIITKIMAMTMIMIMIMIMIKINDDDDDELHLELGPGGRGKVLAVLIDWLHAPVSPRIGGQPWFVFESLYIFILVNVTKFLSACICI